MTPHAARLLRSIQQAGQRRTMRWHRHHACLTSTRAVDAANELVRLGEVRAVNSEGMAVDKVREGGEGVLVEINYKGARQC
ncbi:MAG: hypothetical protein ACREMZ_12910 [Gemmatimonadales bacterium]